MPKSNISVSHSLPQAEALRRIKNLLPAVKAQYAKDISDLKEEWTGNEASFTLKAKGFPVRGTLTVTASEARAFLDLPFAANFFKGKIERAVREEAEKALKS